LITTLATRINYGNEWLTANAFLFEPKADPTNTSARWTQWIQRFNTYLVASNVKENVRKRSLLLYQGGPEVHEIFKTLPDTGDEKNYEAAVNALTAYFEAEKNRTCQTYQWRSQRRVSGHANDRRRRETP
jgi:hypothetical protein